MHEKGGVTPKESRQVTQWFRSSRYVFFRKHFGSLRAIALHVLLLITEEWRLILLACLATFLRFYRLPDWMPFIPDQGRDYLVALESLESGTLPLLGIPSSVPRFHQGPVFIWFLMGMFYLFGTEAYIPAYGTVLLGVAAVICLYFLLEKKLSRQAAFVGGLFAAVSPVFVLHSRLAYHISPIPLFSAFFLYALTRRWKSRWDVFLAFFAFGCLFQFELVAAPLFLLLVLVFRRRVGVSEWMRSILFGFSGLLLSLLPQLVFDITNRFSQLGLFIVWLGYRIISFVSPGTEHSMHVVGVIENMSVLADYFYRIVSWQSGLVAILAFGVVLHGTIAGLRVLPAYTLHSISSLWLLLMLLAFLVHGGTSEAHITLLLIPIVIQIGYSVSWLQQRVTLGSIGVLFGLYILWQVLFLFQQDFLVRTDRVFTHDLIGMYGAPLSVQQRVVETIASFGSDTSLSLKVLSDVPLADSTIDAYRYLFRQRGIDDKSPTGKNVWFLYNLDAHDVPLIDALIYSDNGIRYAVEL